MPQRLKKKQSNEEKNNMENKLYINIMDCKNLFRFPDPNEGLDPDPVILRDEDPLMEAAEKGLFLVDRPFFQALKKILEIFLWPLSSRGRGVRP